MERIAVVGAGLGGMSAAIRLAHAGRHVEVFEQQGFAGGKAGSKWLGRYRFDTGPSLLTMPFVFQQLFEEVGESLSDYLTFFPLDDVCRYFYPDGSRLTSYSNADKFERELQIRGFLSAESLKPYLSYCRRIYETTHLLFLQRSLHEIRTYLTLKTLKSLLTLNRIDAFRTMDSANRSFFRDPRLVQLFNRYATYNGSSPFLVPGTLNIIPHVEYGIGSAAAAGGIYSIPLALRKLAEKKGVQFHFNTHVEKILVSGRSRKPRIRGVQARGEKLSFDLVVSNVDVLTTYRDLLQDEDASLYKRYRRLEPSSSGLVFFMGIKESIPELGLHNIFFSPDYRREFTDIFHNGDICNNPTIYVNITSKVTHEDAPENGENWFVLINAPTHRGQDWVSISERIKTHVLQQVGKAVGKELQPLVEETEVMTPADIEQNTGSNGGSLYGISSNARMAAFLRHPNRSRRYRNLYICGGSAHPGGGMPLAVLSGKIVSDIIQRRNSL